MPRRARIEYRCSFCGKSQEQVHRLVAGPGGVYICDQCVDSCQEIISQERVPDTVEAGQAYTMPERLAQQAAEAVEHFFAAYEQRLQRVEQRLEQPEMSGDRGE